MLVRKITGFSPLYKNQQNFGKKYQSQKTTDEYDNLSTPILKKNMRISKNELNTMVKNMSQKQRKDYLSGKFKDLEVEAKVAEIAQIIRIIQSRGENPFED